MKKQLLIITLLLFSISAFASHPQLKAFPEEKEGLKRFVIVLPHKEREAENNFKVELIPGKTMLTDGVNKMRLGTSIKAQPLIGWGYTYYEVVGKDIAMSTMIAVPEGMQETEQFVQGTSLLIQYNSRLPIVIYAPEGYEIQYRIWQASMDKKMAEMK